ncbi:hypothetical protein Q3G72_029121 [Acer saccharum]|nr:hypothetical protein Q3G72_029121 [Acer saccharum]
MINVEIGETIARIRMTEDPAPVDHWWLSLSSLLGLQTSKAQSFSDKPDMDRADSSFKKVAEKGKFRRGKVKESRGVRKVNRNGRSTDTSSSELKGRSGFFLLKGECSRRANPIGPMVTDSVGLSGPSNQGVELKEKNDGLQDQAYNLSRPDKASLIGEHERGMLLGQDHSSDNGQGFNSRNSHLGLVKNISGGC